MKILMTQKNCRFYKKGFKKKQFIRVLKSTKDWKEVCEILGNQDVYWCGESENGGMYFVKITLHNIIFIVLHLISKNEIVVPVVEYFN